MNRVRTTLAIVGGLILGGAVGGFVSVSTSSWHSGGGGYVALGVLAGLGLGVLASAFTRG
jgi:hypothetical protein